MASGGTIDRTWSALYSQWLKCPLQTGYLTKKQVEAEQPAFPRGGLAVSMSAKREGVLCLSC